MSLYDFGLKPQIIRIFAKHRQFVPTLKIGGDKKSEFIAGIDAATGPEVVRFIDAMEAGTAEPYHFLDVIFVRVFSDPEEGDEMNHGADQSVTPLKRALLQRIQVGDKKNSDETEHGKEKYFCSSRNLLAVNHGPRIEEDNLDVEKDKKHRHEVEFDAEAGLTIADWIHAAFVGGILDLVPGGTLAE